MVSFSFALPAICAYLNFISVFEGFYSPLSNSVMNVNPNLSLSPVFSLETVCEKHESYGYKVFETCPRGTYESGFVLGDFNANLPEALLLDSQFSNLKGQVNTIVEGMLSSLTYSVFRGPFTNVTICTVCPEGSCCPGVCPRSHPYHCELHHMTGIRQPCPAGYYCGEQSHDCHNHMCPVNHYCPEGSSEPIHCPRNTYSVKGATSLASCLSCGVDHYVPCNFTYGLETFNGRKWIPSVCREMHEEHEEHEKCEHESKQQERREERREQKESECQVCPAGYVYDSSSTDVCIPCTPKVVSTPCNMNGFTGNTTTTTNCDGTVSTSDCTVCDTGSYSNADNGYTCKPCADDQILAGDQASCTCADMPVQSVSCIVNGTVGGTFNFSAFNVNANILPSVNFSVIPLKLSNCTYKYNLTCSAPGYVSQNESITCVGGVCLTGSGGEVFNLTLNAIVLPPPPCEGVLNGTVCTRCNTNNITSLSPCYTGLGEVQMPQTGHIITTKTGYCANNTQYFNTTDVSYDNCSCPVQYSTKNNNGSCSCPAGTQSNGMACTCINQYASFNITSGQCECNLGFTRNVTSGLCECLGVLNGTFCTPCNTNSLITTSPCNLGRDAEIMQVGNIIFNTTGSCSSGNQQYFTTNSTSDCSCPVQYSTLNGDGSCSCPTGTQSNGTVCICPDSNASFNVTSKQCKCNTGFTDNGECTCLGVLDVTGKVCTLCDTNVTSTFVSSCNLGQETLIPQIGNIFNITTGSCPNSTQQYTTITSTANCSCPVKYSTANVDGSCSCPFGSFYNGELNSCQCNSDFISTINSTTQTLTCSCPTNSTSSNNGNNCICNDVNANLLSGLCQCNLGFNTNSNGSCDCPLPQVISANGLSCNCPTPNVTIISSSSFTLTSTDPVTCVSVFTITALANAQPFEVNVTCDSNSQCTVTSANNATVVINGTNITITTVNVTCSAGFQPNVNGNCVSCPTMSTPTLCNTTTITSAVNQTAFYNANSYQCSNQSVVSTSNDYSSCCLSGTTYNSRTNSCDCPSIVNITFSCVDSYGTSYTTLTNLSDINSTLVNELPLLLQQVSYNPINSCSTGYSVGCYLFGSPPVVEVIPCDNTTCYNSTGQPIGTNIVLQSTPCEVGNYSNVDFINNGNGQGNVNSIGITNGYCLPCPTNVTGFTGNNDIDGQCFVCLGGQRRSFCPAGYRGFQIISETNCRVRGQNNISFSSNSTDLSNCNVCLPGTYSDGSDGICHSCSELGNNMYQPLKNSSTCYTCDASYITNVDLTTCVCPQNTFPSLNSTTNVTSCRPCNFTNSLYVAITCRGGEGGGFDNVTRFHNCNGTISTTRMTVVNCTACLNDTISVKMINSTDCRNYTVCQSCPTGTFPNDKHTECLTCPSGFYLDYTTNSTIDPQGKIVPGSCVAQCPMTQVYNVDESTDVTSVQTKGNNQTRVCECPRPLSKPQSQYFRDAQSGCTLKSDYNLQSNSTMTNNTIYQYSYQPTTNSTCVPNCNNLNGTQTITSQCVYSSYNPNVFASPKYYLSSNQPCVDLGLGSGVTVQSCIPGQP
jgi:hypothetical protein